MNSVQTRALTCVMNLEREERAKREDDLFRQMMLAMHPQNARQIMHMFETADHEAEQKAVEQIMPQGHEEAQEILGDLQRFGISLRTDGRV